MRLFGETLFAFGFILVALLFFTYSIFLPQEMSAAAVPFASGTYVSGEVLIQYDQSTFDAHMIAVHSESGSASISSDDPVQSVKDFFVKKGYVPLVTDTLHDLQVQVVILDKSGEPLEHMTELAKLPGVVHVQPNFLYSYSANDPWFPTASSPSYNKQNNMWHLSSTQVRDLSSTKDAWDRISSLSGRTYKPRVAVIDDGVLTSYSDLSFPQEYDCKIPEFGLRFFRVAGGGEKVEYTPKTMKCGKGGIGFDKKTFGYSISTTVDPSSADYFHGTQVASVLAANRNNKILGAGVAGSNSEIELIPIRVHAYKDNNGEEKFDSVTIMRAIAFARLNDVDIINASFGEMHEKGSCGDHVDRLTHKQIEKFGKEGGLFVVAVGNDDSKTGIRTSTSFPSDFNHTIPGCSKWSALSDYIIVVGGTERSDKSDDRNDIEHDVNGDGVSGFVEKGLMGTSGVIQEIRWNRDWNAKYRRWDGSNYGSHVNIAAPSKNIMVSGSSATISSPLFFPGTSFAAPQVAGTLALMKYANPSLSASDLKKKLEESADELISLVGPDCTPGTSDDYVNRGRRLNAYNAVQEALGNSYTKKEITDAEKAACRACEGGTQTWTVGGYTCEADLPDVVIYGASHTVTDSDGNTAGQATYSCTRNDGLLVPSNRTCGAGQCPLSTPNKPDITEGVNECTIDDNDRGTFEYRVAMSSGGVVNETVETRLPHTFENLASGTRFSFSVQRRNPHSACTTWSPANRVAICTPKGVSCASCTTDLGSITTTVTRPNQTLVSTCNSESRTGKHASYYTFTLRSAAEVTIDLTSDTIDMYLFLHKHDGAKQCGVGKNEDSNDDRGGDRTTHSRITKSLTAGTYIIEATTYYANRTGSFDLKITPTSTKQRRCTGCTTWESAWEPAIVNQCGNVDQEKACKVKSPAGCAGTVAPQKRTINIPTINGGWSDTTWGTCTCTASKADSASAGTQTGTRTCTNPTPNRCGTDCSGSTTPTRTCTVSAGNCPVTPPTCTGCAAWKDWTPPITNQCGDVKQKRDCKTLTPAGCVGSFPPENRTENIPTINGGWSDTTWGTCTCTASKADSASAGTQTGTRTCTNPKRNRCGADCSGSATPTRTCTVSAGNCPVTPVSCTSCTTSLGTLTSTVTEADQSLITTCNSESRSGKHAKYYTFTLGSTTAVTIDLTSDTIDTYLYLHKHDGAKQCGVGKEEDSNDDRGGDRTTHSRITKSLTAGTYIIEATTYYSNRTGSFDLKVTPACTTAIDGGWTTLPAASTITCGTTQTATCENPAPSCGGSQCSGNAPTVTGTKCSTGNICSAGKCVPSCTTAPTPSTFTVTAGDTTLRADFTLFNNLYAYQRAISDSSATCAGSTWGVESDGHQDYTNLINGKTYYICLRSRWKEGACKNDWSASRVVTGTPTAQTVVCTSCQTWNPWYPAIVNQCGDVDQTRSCYSKLPAGCTGRIANQNRTYTVPETDGGWSDTTWGTCTCTASKADSASAGTQTGTRTCTNPTPNRCGADCSGSTTPTRTCTVSAGNCPVTPTSTACSWQRVSCGTKVCGPQQAVCGPTSCTGTCPYTNDTTAQPGDTGTYANGCGTCSNGETCNSSGQCTTPSVACSWQNNSCTNKCGTITGTCGPTGCTGTCRYTNDRRAQPGDTGTRNCGSCSSGYTCSNNTCVKNPTTRVDGGWSSWSSCTCTSQTNDGNAGTQTRTCTNPAPSGGGSACSGSSSQDCTASGCDTTSSCSSRPCSTSCRSSITWGSCHAGHTHSGGYQHTQPQRHGSYTCHGSSTIRWTSENCTLSSCGAWSNRYCGTAGNNTNKVRRHRDCSGVRQWETVEDCSASNKTCLAGYCF